MNAIQSLDGKSVVMRLLPKQALAAGCPADIVLFGGTKGPGKSFAMIMRAAPIIQLAHEKWKATGRQQSMARIAFFRHTIKECKDLIGKSKELYPLLDPEMGMRGWSSSENRWRFTSGLEIYFAHLESPDDYKNWNGVELLGLGVDQAEEIPKHQVMFLVGQIRSSDPDYAREKFAFLTANPGGRYAEWIYEDFVKPFPGGMEFIEHEVKVKGGAEAKVITSCFIPAELSDNPYLYESGDYEATLRRMTPLEQEWYIKGNWLAAASGHFSDVLDPNIHFIDSFPANPHWEMKLGIDWGEKHPAVCLVAVKDPATGAIYVIDELYRPGITGRIFGSAMEEMWLKQQWSPGHRWEKYQAIGHIDPSAAWSRTQRKGGDNVSVPAAISSFGFTIWPSDNERVSGWQQIKERLVIDKTTGKPLLYVFRDRCPNLTRELLKIESDAKKPGDVDTNQSDHALDALRYICLNWPLSFYDRSHDDEYEEEELWRRVRQATAPSDEMTTGYGD